MDLWAEQLSTIHLPQPPLAPPASQSPDPAISPNPFGTPSSGSSDGDVNTQQGGAQTMAGVVRLTTPPTSIELVSIVCADGDAWSGIPSTLAWKAVATAPRSREVNALLRTSCTDITVTAALLDAQGRAMMPGRYEGVLATLSNHVIMIDVLPGTNLNAAVNNTAAGGLGPTTEPTQPSRAGPLANGTVAGSLGMESLTGPQGQVSWPRLGVSARPGIYAMEAFLQAALDLGLPQTVSSFSHVRLVPTVVVKQTL